jgi:hypothetical protein
MNIFWQVHRLRRVPAFFPKAKLSNLSDLARRAAKNGDLARNFPYSRRLCSHRLLKPVKILTQTSILNSGSPEPLNGTLLPQGSAATSWSFPRNASPRLFPESWFTPCGAASQSNHLPPVNDFSPLCSKSDRLLDLRLSALDSVSVPSIISRP